MYNELHMFINERQGQKKMIQEKESLKESVIQEKQRQKSWVYTKIIKS